MAKYELPYKYEIEYVHMDGRCYFNLGEALKSRESLFNVEFKYDERPAGMIVANYGNGSNNVYDVKVPANFVNFRPDATHGTALVSVKLTDRCMLFDAQYSEGTSVTDPYSKQNYTFWADSSVAEPGRHRVIGYYTTVYLKKGERLSLFGHIDDTLFVRLNGVQMYYKFSDDTSVAYPSGLYRYYHSWEYTAPYDGYYDLEVIGANHGGPGGGIGDGTIPFRMTLAPADAKITRIPYGTSRPTTGNKDGDICIITRSQTSGSTTYNVYDEAIWKAGSWVTQRLGNVDLSEPRFFVPDYCTRLQTFPFGCRTTAATTGSTRCQHYLNVDTSDFSYGNKAAKTTSTPASATITTGQMTSKTNITYYDGKIRENGTIIAEADSTATFPTSASTTYYLIVGNIYPTTTSYVNYTGLVGNLYSATLNNTSAAGVKLSENYWYPVVDKDNAIKLYNMKTGKTVPVSKKSTLGAVTAGPLVHTHDYLFEVKETPGNILGTIPGNEKILTGDDVAWAYKNALTIPDIATDPNRTVVLAANTGGYSEGTILVAKKNKSGAYMWSQLSTPTEGVGYPYGVRSHRIGNKVWIRWKDPDDTKTQYGVVTCKWKYTRLLRKLGSEPTGPYDGQVVVQSTIRNYYDNREFIDILPPNVGINWCYKLFAFSEDGVMTTHSDAAFVPPELDWAKMRSYIVAGRAPSIFGVGDVIQMSGGSGIYEDIEFVVAGFDVDTPADKKHSPHTMTLLSRYCPAFTTGGGYFDKPWGAFRLVKDEIVLETGKTVYFTYDAETMSYRSADPQPTAGKHITEQDGLYVRVTNSDRANYGSNQWAECALRQWLNETRIQIYKLTADKTVVTGKTYYKKETDGTYATVTPVPAGSNPNANGWYQDGYPLTFVTTSLPPFLGLKALDMQETTDSHFIYGKAYYTFDVGTQNYVVASVTPGAARTGTYYEVGGFFNCITKHVNTTALNHNVASGGVNSIQTTDFVSVPSITEVFGVLNNNIQEGEALEYFSVIENSKQRKKNNTAKTATDWWLRSPDTTTESTGRYVKVDGTDNTSAVNTDKGVTFKIVLG